jgi:hypothetical protein
VTAACPVSTTATAGTGTVVVVGPGATVVDVVDVPVAPFTLLGVAVLFKGNDDCGTVTAPVSTDGWVAAARAVVVVAVGLLMTICSTGAAVVVTEGTVVVDVVVVLVVVVVGMGVHTA